MAKKCGYKKGKGGKEDCGEKPTLYVDCCLYVPEGSSAPAVPDCEGRRCMAYLCASCPAKDTDFGNGMEPATGYCVGPEECCCDPYEG